MKTLIGHKVTESDDIIDVSPIYYDPDTGKVTQGIFHIIKVEKGYVVDGYINWWEMGQDDKNITRLLTRGHNLYEQDFDGTLTLLGD